MDVLKIVGVGFLAAGLGKLLSGNKAAKSLLVAWDIHKINLTGGKPTIEFKYTVTNPSGGKLNIKAIGGEVFWKNERVGILKMLTPVTIEPRSTTEFFVPVQLDLIGIVLVLISTSVKNWKGFDIKGTYYTTIGDFTFNEFIGIPAKLLPV